MQLGEFELKEPVPELRDTCAIAMLRPWIDVGKVGTLVLNRLEQKLDARELARLKKPGTYFDFTRYRPRTRIVEGRRVFTTPNSIVRYAHDDESKRDYMFLHLREPHAMGEDYSEAIVTLLDYFNVTEYCRIGGMYDSVPHTRPVMITGTLNEDRLEQTVGLVSPRKNTYQGPTSIVNLVNEAMTEAEVDTVNLMAHLPQYVQLDEDHMGAARLMEVLCALYGFPKSLADPTRGEKQYKELNRAVENNPEIRILITQLEAYYDRVLVKKQTPDESISFAPEVESFLEEMGDRLENQRDTDDDG